MYIRESDFDKLGFSKIKQLQPKIWKDLAEDKKASTLQECSNRICDFEKRERSQVKVVDLNKTKDGSRVCEGAFCQSTNTIVIDQNFLKRASSYDSFATLIHESMHGYQFHAMKNDGFHKNLVELKDWQEGRRDYSSDIKHPILYKSNGLEVYSFNQDNQFTRILKHEHEIRNSQEQLKKELKSRQQQPNKSSPKKIVVGGLVITQLSDNQFQFKDPSSGKLKTYSTKLPKEKTLEETLKSNPNLISKIDKLEKGQKLTGSFDKKPTQIDSKINSQQANNSNQSSTAKTNQNNNTANSVQQKNKDNDFER